jgi:hypothetical protein
MACTEAKRLRQFDAIARDDFHFCKFSHAQKFARGLPDFIGWLTSSYCAAGHECGPGGNAADGPQRLSLDQQCKCMSMRNGTA